jgi:hypothetical protein
MEIPENQKTKTGKPIPSNLHHSIGKMIGLNIPNGLKLKLGYAYRSVSRPEIQHLVQEGFLLTNPNNTIKKPRAQTTQKMFSKFNPNMPNAAYPTTSLILKVAIKNIPTQKGKAIAETQIKVLHFLNNAWVEETPQEFLKHA